MKVSINITLKKYNEQQTRYHANISMCLWHGHTIRYMHFYQSIKLIPVVSKIMYKCLLQESTCHSIMCGVWWGREQNISEYFHFLSRHLVILSQTRLEQWVYMYSIASL